MPKKVAVVAVAGALSAIFAAPAAAHQNHESCAGGAPVFVPALGGPAPGPAFGPFASGLARAGLAKETVTVIHALCEPHAPGE